MAIDFSAERWKQVKTDAREWWAGRLKRPLIQMQMWGRDPGRAEPALEAKDFTSHYDNAIAPDRIVDRWDYNLSCVEYLGDSFPNIWPNFGPGVITAFMGCDLVNGENTSWFHPKAKRGIKDISFRFDPDAPWFKRVQSICLAAKQRWGGAVQVGMTDLGGNLDILQSFRPGEQLLLDLYDNPDEVKRLAWEAHEAWWRCFDALNESLRPNPGYTGWAPIFSEEPYYMLQCDFCYMIGPEMFDEFVKPELQASCRRLKNAFYHLDGVGQLPHLDSLLSIPELKGVQWVPGSGKPGTSHWPEVYRKIRKAGKLIQMWADENGFNTLDILAEQLGSAEGIVFFAGARPEDRSKVLDMLRRHGCR